MSSILAKSLVRIYNENRRIVGTGFLVSERHILTCAHVIRDALGLESTPSDCPKAQVHLEFPFAASGNIIIANIVHWTPRRADGSGDIAGLELAAFPPRNTRPLLLKVTAGTELKNKPFCTYGFPQGLDGGVWAYGTCKDERVNGSVQLEDNKATGRFIERGFSGSPVWNEELEQVTGMVVTADSQVQTSRVAFMIPAQKIVEFWPDIPQLTEPLEYVDIPIVIIAMNDVEANDLFHTQAFPKFQQLIHISNPEDIADWLTHYRPDRNDWLPHVFMNNEYSIQKAISDIIYEINYVRNNTNNSTLIRPKFVSQQFLDDSDQAAQTEAWDDVTDSGGIVIIDEISLFHPIIQSTFVRSGIDSKNTPVLTLSPVSKYYLETGRLIENELQTWMRRTFGRFSETFDDFCEFSVSNSLMLDRWLFKTLPKTADRVFAYRSNPDNLQKFRRQRSYRNRGYGQIIARGIAIQ